MHLNGTELTALCPVDHIRNKTKTIFQGTGTACTPSEGLKSSTSRSNPADVPSGMHATHEVGEQCLDSISPASLRVLHLNDNRVVSSDVLGYRVPPINNTPFDRVANAGAVHKNVQQLSHCHGRVELQVGAVIYRCVITISCRSCGHESTHARHHLKIKYSFTDV